LDDLIFYRNWACVVRVELGLISQIRISAVLIDNLVRHGVSGRVD
jgi:hypothetical protein